MPTNNATNSAAKPVRIRMYRQGLGDCFLLRFPRATGQPFHLVIDSGVIKGTANSGAKMSEIARDIERETNGKIDALVVTHEHWDHVSGFTEAQEIWKRMDIAEVWLAWTEDPEDELASKIRKDREDRKAGIKNKIAALANGSSFRLDATRGSRIDALLGFLGFGLGAAGAAGGGTKAALDFIVGQAAKPIYHAPGTSFTREEIAGVRIYVLGPPRDEKKIKKSNPSTAHPEVYSDPEQAFAFSGTEPASGDEDLERPFGLTEGIEVRTPEEYDNLFSKHFGGSLPLPDPTWRRFDYANISEIERLALALDGDTNNSSLALAFEFEDGRVLLFPADSQVGNCLSWQDHTWSVGAKSVRADDLLARTVVYKVGHHGSHNATLKDLGLEKMIHRDLIALVPVDKAMAVKKRWKMPFPPLYKRLLERTRGRVILADASEPLPKDEQLNGLTSTERKRFRDTVSASELFIDFIV